MVQILDIPHKFIAQYLDGQSLGALSKSSSYKNNDLDKEDRLKISLDEFRHSSTSEQQETLIQLCKSKHAESYETLATLHRYFRRNEKRQVQQLGALCLYAARSNDENKINLLLQDVQLSDLSSFRDILVGLSKEANQDDWVTLFKVIDQKTPWTPEQKVRIVTQSLTACIEQNQTSMFERILSETDIRDGQIKFLFRKACNIKAYDIAGLLVKKQLIDITDLNNVFLNFVTYNKFGQLKWLLQMTKHYLPTSCWQTGHVIQAYEVAQRNSFHNVIKIMDIHKNALGLQ